MAVLLLILKIIGIILLILLGLILLILAVVLFVPVRYQVSGSIGEKTTARIAVTWLLHAVSWRHGVIQNLQCKRNACRGERSAYAAPVPGAASHRECAGAYGRRKNPAAGGDLTGT